VIWKTCFARGDFKNLLNNRGMSSLQMQGLFYEVGSEFQLLNGYLDFSIYKI